jgi:CheY-like chemotaxis protein
MPELHLLSLGPSGPKGSNAAIAITEFPCVIGRNPGCDNGLNDTRISRQHCAFTLRDGQVFVEDLGSRNGTCLNGVAVAGPRVVADGDRLQLAGLPFRVCLPGRPAQGPVPGRLDALCADVALLKGQVQAALPPEAAAALGRIEAGLQALRGSSGPAHTALLVEDNANERELLALFLRQAGVAVDTAGDGADALDYLHTHPRPDVVLLDMGLPRCDGPTTVRSIRADPACAGVKIVAVTGHAAEEFGLAVGPGGVDCWFQKPVDPAVLVRDLELELTGEGRSS